MLTLFQGYENMLTLFKGYENLLTLFKGYENLLTLFKGYENFLTYLRGMKNGFKGLKNLPKERVGKPVRVVRNCVGFFPEYPELQMTRMYVLLFTRHHII